MPGLHHVDPGGRPLRLALSDRVGLTKLSVGPMDNNAYLLRAPGGSLLIDAANDPERIDAAVEGEPPATVVTTHRHGDHLQALPDLAARWSSRLVAGRPDVAAIAEETGVPEPDGVWDGDTLAFGDAVVEVVGLVGHTPGSITLVFRPESGPVHLFTGDSLFPGGPGKTWSTEDFGSLMDDLETKVFGVFDDDTVVHPGHGDATTLGIERPQLAVWRARGW
ncbi:glyoxylase-like metal-dependent hydrolase (beta-lactamase superfamily II) [Friedmanniella endophytica]|uniref:Glyoxylase-like metal-dependent hydrolase (Beta-lactamase superfamily II) n=1 Tax=Microlunatus kandeliicorticis TaxID=1759536 RepID=A0A7W3P5U6_9ACTN|nr:MBL fold metallo-hydrolase [Microlunatus kandeliicorticis]MBA8794278.1 glyoxylase-like metal-dependent hydrolase (beta-lactamase superfamily II) [Microlunatus kandeliicorticis]